MQWWRSFTGSDKPGYRKCRRQARDNALLFLFGGFVAAYVISEFALSRQIHPIHWLGAAIGTVMFYVVGYIWFLQRA